MDPDHVARMEKLEAKVDELTLELVTQRLVTRSLILYLILQGKQSIASIVTGMEEASKRTTVGVLPLPGVEPTLQAKASERAKARGQELLYSLGRVIAAPEPELPESSVSRQRV